MKLVKFLINTCTPTDYPYTNKLRNFDTLKSNSVHRPTLQLRQSMKKK